MNSWTRAALAYADLGWRVVPCHHPIAWQGDRACSCIHKPDRKDPSKCVCGHVRDIPNAPCSCGRSDCRVRCSGKPCKSIGKHPRTPHGLKDATIDEQQIREWGERWPVANLAVVLGHESGIFAFDLDRHAENEDGIENFEILCSELSVKLPETPTQLTGGGGQHVIFKHPGADVTIGNRTKNEAIRPGVEIKGDGGYIVVSPSVHKCGKQWRWEASSHPLDIAVAECPPELLALLVGEKAKPRPQVEAPAERSFIARAFDAAGWLGLPLPNGSVAVRCPWLDQHSDGRGDGNDSSTVVLPPTKEQPLGGFKCKHGHCGHRTVVTALFALPEKALASQAAVDPQGFSYLLSILRARNP